MNEVSINVSQAAILGIQDILLQGDTVKEDCSHYFADGVYARLIKVPAGHHIVGKAHATKHITIMLKGECTFIDDNGQIVEITAPMITVSAPGLKKMAYCLTECWFVNVHPTDTEDLEVIESKVIIPEEEYRAMIEAQHNELELEGVA